jgi:hypothetical protein
LSPSSPKRVAGNRFKIAGDFLPKINIPNDFGLQLFRTSGGRGVFQVFIFLLLMLL